MAKKVIIVPFGQLPLVLSLPAQAAVLLLN